MLWENDFAPAEAVTPRNPANRSGQHQLPTASNIQLVSVRSARLLIAGCCLSVDLNFLSSENANEGTNMRTICARTEGRKGKEQGRYRSYYSLRVRRLVISFVRNASVDSWLAVDILPIHNLLSSSSTAGSCVSCRAIVGLVLCRQQRVRCRVFDVVRWGHLDFCSRNLCPDSPASPLLCI